MTNSMQDSDYNLLGASFRDPSGFIFTQDGTVYRQINRSYQDTYNTLIQSGLYDALLENNLLIPHEEISIKPPVPELAYKIIQPERIEFISYPYEWSFSQLKDAALTTLNIQKLALNYGLSLKDSSVYNIQFHQGYPVLIDTLSFDSYVPGKPWVAYRQFCQHFLAPLSIMAYQDIRLSGLFINFIDGVPLDLASHLLPFRTRLNPSLLLHIHLHASSQKRYAGLKPDTRRSVNENAFLGLIDSLETAVRRLQWSASKSGWSAYYQDEQSYSTEGLVYKQKLVSELISQIQPGVVWDLGANTGLYSRFASENGAYTLAFDYDPTVVELNYREVKNKQEANLLPLVQDLTNPSPAIGWQNQERSSLIQRANADAILALALIHHLAIANNVPLDYLAGFFQSLARWLIVEFVPKSDPQVQRLLIAREDIFPDYTVEGFEYAFGKHFTIKRVETVVDSNRRIYLMEKQ